MYLYPVTKVTYQKGSNTYIHNLMAELSQDYNIVNKKTSLGLLDVLLKLPKTDIIYLNWVEDIVDKRFAKFQVLLLFIIVFLSKISKTKIIWFVHNNISHFKKNLWLKKQIVTFLTKYASLVLSHSREITFKIPPGKFFSFDHPVEELNLLKNGGDYEYDLLIWGTVSPYKGVEELLNYNYSSPELLKYKILVAGKFQSIAYFERLQKFARPNVVFDNRILPENELERYISKSKYILFTYNSPSVLSSAALCKSLSYGKPIIGPFRGSFKELGQKGLIYNYQDFSCLRPLLEKLRHKEELVDRAKLLRYIEANSWANFTQFINETINNDLKVSLPLLSH